MIAVYYVASASPRTMFVVKVEDDQHHKFIETLTKEGLPMPDEEVLFIENENVVNEWNWRRD